jgi:HPt (histidine-containing phosphotransfer) domain-containing protein
VSDAAFDDEALGRLRRMISASRADEIFSLYLENTPGRMSEVRDGLARSDLSRVGRALHDMKSSAGMLGARALERLALEMERDAANGDGAALSAKVERLAEAVEAAQRWVGLRREEG